MCSVKRAGFRHKTKNPFPPLPLHPRGFKIKTLGENLQINQNLCSLFVYLEKILWSKIWKCDIFKTKKDFKKGGIRFLFLNKFYIILKFETSRIKGKSGK